MYLIGFLRSVIPMLACLVGIFLFTVRREHCEKKFFLCVCVIIALEYLTYYFTFSDAAGDQGFAISKVLTSLLISLLIFWGGLYVYGGWSRIGIFIFASDMVLGIGERLYLAAWEYFTHRTAERSMIYYQGNQVIEKNSFPMFLFDCILMIPFLIGGYKMRSRPLRPEWLFKTIVIAYLVIGSTPLVVRPGFGVEGQVYTLFVEFVWIMLCFLVLMTIRIQTVREYRRILYLRKQVAAEQSRLLMTQKEKVRRLRHDVRKHLSNLEYILEKEPRLRSDPSILRYKEKLNANEEWMRGVLYCDSPALNLCFEQIRSYCDDRGIAPEIVLKRLNVSGWLQEDQLTFGTLLFNLLQLYGRTRPIETIQYSGDCLLGQNLLRITMVFGTDGGVNQAKQKDGKKDEKKDRKLIYNLEKDIRLILSKYSGRIERVDDSGHLEYVISWEDGNTNKQNKH